MRRAVAEDEWLLADDLCRHLEEELGHEVVGAVSTAAALVDVRLAHGGDGLRAARVDQRQGEEQHPPRWPGPYGKSRLRAKGGPEL